LQKNPKADMNVVVSNLLKYGLIVSTSLIVLGVALLFARTPGGFPESLQQLVSSNYGKPTLSAGALFSGLTAADPGSVLELGLIVLLATPVARVAASVVLFAEEKDRTYVAITLFVLAVLLVSTFIIGPFEAS
jgi:uncharacterized membrane protein